MAASDGVKVFKIKSWRKKGVALPDVLEQYMSINPELNVMPFCSQFIPMEVGSVLTDLLIVKGRGSLRLKLFNLYLFTDIPGNEQVISFPKDFFFNIKRVLAKG